MNILWNIQQIEDDQPYQMTKTHTYICTIQSDSMSYTIQSGTKQRELEIFSWLTDQFSNF